MKFFSYGYPHSNALLQFYLNVERYTPHKAACHLTKCGVINDITISDSISKNILSQFFDVIQSDVALQKQMHWNYVCNKYRDFITHFIDIQVFTFSV